MIIINEEGNSIDTITLLLTNSEALELRDSLEDIIKLRTGTSHAHINDSDYRKEITVCTYKKGGVSDEGFDEITKEFILNEK